MQDLGLRGDKFTIKYGVILRPFGKDSSHTLTERDWERLPQALQNPFAISKLTDKNDAYRIYTTLQTENGEFIVVGVDVKSVGREIEVNAISIVFGRRNNANLPQNEDVIYKSKEITLEQSALLERPNFVQYPIIQEFSDSKDTTNSKKVNSLEQENTNATKNTNAELHKKKSSPETASVQKEHQPTAISSDDVAKVLQDIVTTKENFSKIVDENGEPLVVYHGIEKIKVVHPL